MQSPWPGQRLTVPARMPVLFRNGNAVCDLDNPEHPYVSGDLPIFSRVSSAKISKEQKATSWKSNSCHLPFAHREVTSHWTRPLLTDSLSSGEGPWHQSMHSSGMSERNVYC